ncbi:hypothetical protein HGRIS_014073 [Hohenbuehelia grisea]|uniref:Uncharacterized protein n=1 Tax=Hohenbuehelia grisea TaxID=104357 RepID=A0ABR3JSX4_9AGAR
MRAFYAITLFAACVAAAPAPAPKPFDIDLSSLDNLGERLSAAITAHVNDNLAANVGANVGTGGTLSSLPNFGNIVDQVTSITNSVVGPGLANVDIGATLAGLQISAFANILQGLGISGTDLSGLDLSNLGLSDLDLTELISSLLGGIFPAPADRK